jgi:hypothetical protein
MPLTKPRPGLTTGETARRSGRIETVRDYERFGLLQLDAIEVGVGDLRRLEREMGGMISLYGGRRIPGCPVIDSLFSRTRARADA